MMIYVCLSIRDYMYTENRTFNFLRFVSNPFDMLLSKVLNEIRIQFNRSIQFEINKMYVERVKKMCIKT